MLSASSASLQLSDEEKKYVQTLISLPLDSIIDSGMGETKCQHIGQEIFDKAKAAYNKDSLAAKDALTRIWNAVRFNQRESQEDASLRKDYIACAWAGIGDNKWRWQCWKITHDESLCRHSFS